MKEEQGRERKRTIHINNVKLYKEREADVYALTVTAEDMGLDESKVRLKGAVGEEGRAMIEKVLEGFQEEYDGSDGYYKGGEAKIIKVLRNYSEFAVVYIDDILIFSNDIAEH